MTATYSWHCTFIEAHTILPHRARTSLVILGIAKETDIARVDCHWCTCPRGPVAHRRQSGHLPVSLPPFGFSGSADGSGVQLPAGLPLESGHEGGAAPRPSGLRVPPERRHLRFLEAVQDVGPVPPPPVLAPDRPVHPLARIASAAVQGRTGPAVVPGSAHQPGAPRIEDPRTPALATDGPDPADRRRTGSATDGRSSPGCGSRRACSGSRSARWPGPANPPRPECPPGACDCSSGNSPGSACRSAQRGPSTRTGTTPGPRRRRRPAGGCCP